MEILKVSNVEIKDGRKGGTEGGTEEGREGWKGRMDYTYRN